MSEDQNKHQELVEKLNNDGFFDEPEELKYATVFGDTSFKTEEDLNLLSILPGLETLCIEKIPDTMTTEKLVSALEKFPALNSLELNYNTITPDLMRGILRLKNIEDIAFKNAEYDESTLKLLCWQDHLKGLRFFMVPPFPECFPEILSTLPQLERLDVSTSRLENISILDFAKENFPNIKSLRWQVLHLSGEEIETMISMGLESFHLAFTELPSEYEDLEFLNRFKSLKSLDLGYVESLTKIDWDLPNLMDLFIFDKSRLQSIDFSGMPHLKRFTLIGFNEENDSPLEIYNLDSLKEIETFEISDMKISKPILSTLSKFSNLYSLTVKDPETLKPEDIQYLSKLKNLKDLELGINDRITPEDIAKLPVFPKLTFLELNNVKPNGVVGEFEKKSPNLQALWIEGKPSDEDIRLFVSKKKKYSIYVSDCSSLSPESINTIFSMKELRSISLDKAPNETLSVRDFPYLKKLNLTGWKNLMEAELVNLPDLKKFPLMCPSLETLQIKDLPGLETLQLQNCPLLYYLSIRNAPKISFLNVLGTPELDLTSLIRLQGLEKLELDLEQFHQDFVLETLQELPKLRKLIIDCDRQKAGQEIKDYFSGGGEPVEDWNSNCPRPERERIQEALPNCEIQFGYDS